MPQTFLQSTHRQCQATDHNNVQREKFSHPPNEAWAQISWRQDDQKFVHISHHKNWQITSNVATSNKTRSWKRCRQCIQKWDKAKRQQEAGKNIEGEWKNGNRRTPKAENNGENEKSPMKKNEKDKREVLRRLHIQDRNTRYFRLTATTSTQHTYRSMGRKTQPMIWNSETAP